MRRSTPWLTALLQLVILVTTVAAAAPWLDAQASSLPIPRRTDDVTLRGHQARPIFNGSVVPGGVYSLDELRAAIKRDPVVAAHYRAMNVDEMQFVTLTEGKAAYVSYRVGNRVFWTRNRVFLKAGETVLTDGHTTIRARCGNCVSDVEQQAVSGVEPAHGELDDFVVPPTPETGADAFSAEAEQRLGDLLGVPFGPEMFASLAPAWLSTLSDDEFGNGGFPVVVVPSGVPPGGGGGTGDGSSGAPGSVVPGGGVGGGDGGGGGGSGGGGSGGPGPGDLPPAPPAVFVPGDGGTGTPGGSGTGGSGGSGTSGTGGTGGTSGSLTESATGSPTGDLTGDLTTGTGYAATTTTGGATTSSGATPAPEPEILWLVAMGLIGVAGRRLRPK